MTVHEGMPDSLRSATRLGVVSAESPLLHDFIAEFMAIFGGAVEARFERTLREAIHPELLEKAKALGGDAVVEAVYRIGGGPDRPRVKVTGMAVRAYAKQAVSERGC